MELAPLVTCRGIILPIFGLVVLNLQKHTRLVDVAFVVACLNRYTIINLTIRLHSLTERADWTPKGYKATWTLSFDLDVQIHHRLLSSAPTASEYPSW